MASNKILFLLALFITLFALPVVTAELTLTASPSGVGQKTVFTGSCSASSVALQVNSLSGQAVWFDQVSVSSGSYSASFVPTKEGSYTVFVSCGGESLSQPFTVGAVSGGTQSSAEASSDGTSGGVSSGASGTSGGGSGGGSGYSSSCTPKWECTSWSYCTADLVQTRTCTDTNKCKKTSGKPIEIQSCAACEESWTCSGWSSCVAGQQTHTCVDTHACGTLLLKPEGVRSCKEEKAFGQTSPQKEYQPPDFFPPQIVEPVTSMWDSYKFYIIGGITGLGLLVVIILLVLHFLHKPKKVQYNVDELHDWVKKESAMGTSREEIISILTKQTGWSREEIIRVFPELQAST